MKYLLLVLSFSVTSFGFTGNQISSNLLVDISTKFLVSQAKYTDLIDWKVGDTANYDVTVSGFPMTMVEKVTQDLGTSLLLLEDLEGLMPQKIETQIQKSDGKVLKVTVNGQDQTLPDPSDFEVSSQSVESVTVPAGTFDAVKVVGHQKSQNADVTIWINTEKLPMEGNVKTLVSQQGTTADFELTSFVKQ